MNQEQLADRIKSVKEGVVYSNNLTSYAIQSIESGRSNYPVANLITYCNDSHLKLTMIDMATEDRFQPLSVLDVHKVLDLLMKRYKIDHKLVYRKTGVHYTPPKSFIPEDLERMKSEGDGKKYVAPLSIKTLLAVCDVIHCDLQFSQK